MYFLFFANVHEIFQLHTDGRKLVKNGIVFNEEARGISEWKIAQ
jgi:hypothetical protein